MMTDRIERRNLDNEQFLKLRQETERISRVLDKRLKGHLSILKPLFTPKKLLGSYVTTSTMEDVPGSAKAFAELQEIYGEICQKPFNLSPKLPSPLPPISNQLSGTPFRYPLKIGGAGETPTMVTSPVRWILSYQSENGLDRVKKMIDGEEPYQLEDMRQTLIHHLAMVLFLRHQPEIVQLLEDLRYKLEFIFLEELGGLKVATLRAPIEVFLPSDEYVFQVTKLSGVSAFQELIDPKAVDNVPDSLKDLLEGKESGLRE